jgi:NADH dehydrogenase
MSNPQRPGRVGGRDGSTSVPAAHLGTVDDVHPVPRVVVVGAGFGGLQCAKALRDKPVDVVLVDRRNYHLFTPLLYQVASCLLNPSEITAPVRKIFRHARNVRYREGDVTGVDFDNRSVELADGARLDYDYLVLSTGSVTNYYGNEAVREHALGLKDLGEALQLRNHVLECLERATRTDDADARRRLLTFCIVGGGPTGVEYAGALAELGRLVVPREYPELSSGSIRILLLEGGDRLLTMFVPSLGAYARAELEHMGVEVRTNTFVESAYDDCVVLHDATEVPTATMIWTAGVQPNDPLHEKPQRLEVDDHFRLAGAPGVFAIGDVAAGRDRHGNVLPMVSPPAMQAGRYVARHIVDAESRRPFRYRDKGTLATIGRRAAVGQIGPLRFRGFIGWVVWLVVHLYYLIGFENRLRVLMRWAWYYVRLDRPVRVMVQADPARE